MYMAARVCYGFCKSLKSDKVNRMKKFSFRATLLLALVLSLTAWNILRLITSLAWRATLIEFAGAKIAAVETISAAVWSVAGAIVAWSILRRKSWAANLLVAAAFAYTIWYWCERLFLQNPRPNGLFVVILNLAALALVGFAVAQDKSRVTY